MVEVITKENSSSHSRFTPKAVLFLLLGVVIFLAISYIFQINKLAVAGGEIKEKEKILKELRREDENLKIEVAQLRSIESLQEASVQLKMSKPQQVSYVTLGEVDSMAMR
jgi:cell division protein FtsL